MQPESILGILGLCAFVAAALLSTLAVQRAFAPRRPDLRRAFGPVWTPDTLPPAARAQRERDRGLALRSWM